MRALVLSIWVFINLVFFGMVGYMYLLWSQYWMYLERQIQPTTFNYDQQIYYYNRGYAFNDSFKHNSSNSRIKHSLTDDTSVTLVKNSKPRFPNLQDKDFEADTRKYDCTARDNTSECNTKTLEYKDAILKEMRKVFTAEGNFFRFGLENRYEVRYEGNRGNYINKNARQLLCQLKKSKVKTLRRLDLAPGAHILREFLPKRGIFENKYYNTCAVVASAGSLRYSKLGKVIDSHDLVLRFNHAPTRGFEEDVGNKTTIRILNSQVVSKPKFEFLDSEMYRKVTILAWDPSNYSAPIHTWLKKPDYDLFANYVLFKKKFPKSKLYLLNPLSLWELWDFLQSNSPGRLRRNPPSSGFLGLALLLPFCNYVDMFEYIPSVRVTKKCHYYDAEDNLACTFGVWHPLAAEKLITYQMNSADEKTVFQRGFVRIFGFKKVRC